MRISHPMVMALSALAVLERHEVDGLPHDQAEVLKKDEPKPVSILREDYPSRQAWRAATKPWKARS